MNDLIKRLDGDFDEAAGWIRIVDAAWLAGDLRLKLSIHHHGREPELWIVMCSGVVEESLCSESATSLNLTCDSPVLKPYIEPEITITFSQNKLSPESFLGVVFSSCIEVMARPEYVKRFVNLSPTVSGIVSSPYGVLGRFPKSVAEKILSVLQEYPILAKALPGNMPRRWDGSALVEYKKLLALETGNSYVIGEKFRVSRA